VGLLPFVPGVRQEAAHLYGRKDSVGLSFFLFTLALDSKRSDGQGRFTRQHAHPQLCKCVGELLALLVGGFLPAEPRVDVASVEARWVFPLVIPGGKVTFEVLPEFTQLLFVVGLLRHRPDHVGNVFFVEHFLNSIDALCGKGVIHGLD
jgi:hypothetical protein